REHVETYRGLSVKMELSDKVRFEIGVSNHFVEPTVRAVLKGARTGEVGDGKIFVVPVEKVFRIRTGEEDEKAVTPVKLATTYPPRRRGSCPAAISPSRQPRHPDRLGYDRGL